MGRGGKSGTNKRSGSFGGNRGSAGRNRGASSSTSSKPKSKASSSTSSQSKSKASASISSGRSKGNSASSSSIGRGKSASTSSASKNRQSGSTNRGRGKETPTNPGRNKVDTTAHEKRKVDKKKQPSKSSVNTLTQNNRKRNETTSRREDTRNRSWFGRNRHRDYDYGYYDEPGGYYRPVRRRRFFSNRYSDPYYHRDQHHHHHHSDQYHEGSQYREGSERRDYRDDRRPPRPRRQRMGCSRNVGIVILVLLGLAAVSMIFSAITDSGEITSSTVEREPLPSGVVDETDYFTDQLGWIDNQTTMLRGLRHFYNETGVQPHVYITDHIAGDVDPSMAEIEAFSNELYDELFTDEAHLLLVFFEPTPGEYVKHYVVGTQARSVIDTEAGDILFDYVEYYYEDNISNAEFFSLVFQDTANRIMEVTTSPWIDIVTAIVVIAILAVAFVWWKRRQEQKKLEAERLEKMLNTDIDTFGQYEAEDLSSKYQDQEENNTNQPS
ncbi:TPM domain-containing protein [Amphibacillus cookii]|uniref:TPM domain-containing protein n=1 Tax=Amphibacillus cookii TaxID=767787 RepID=UPI0019574B62|nr:TPM domain-containing protein [Amphibacillus cookii]MBM7541068.1 hypothetical protein [Amphibacillus cookii]